MKKPGGTWSSFPPEHRKRCYQAIAAYLLLCLVVGVWISLNARNTVKDWQSRIPSAQAMIKNAEVPAVTPAAGVETPLPEEQPTIADITAPAPPTFTGAPSVPVFNETSGSASDGRIYISMIVTNMGLSESVTEKALNILPKEVTLAFSPYATNLSAWLERMRQTDRERLIFMPMESARYPLEDPGPRAMSSRLSDEENNDNLAWVLNQDKDATGIINYMGSRFLLDKKRLIPVLQTLKKNRSMFIEAFPPANSAVPELAGEFDLPYLAVDLKIDNDTKEESIRQQLEKLEKLAKERGYAIGIAEPYPLTLSTITSWSTKLRKQGIVLAPLRTVWKNKPHDTKATLPAQQAPE